MAAVVEPGHGDSDAGHLVPDPRGRARRVDGSVHLNVRYGDKAPVITGFSPTSGPPGTEVHVTGTNLFAVEPNGFIVTLNGFYAPPTVT